MVEKIREMIEDFEKKRPLYDSFSKKIESLITVLLEEEKIKTHSITSRPKEIKSFKKKITQKIEKYNKYTDITDLSGVRIICFSTDQVDNVEKLIKKNFKVLRAPYSVDKKEIMDPDRFGYLSLHLIVKISKDRSILPEYSKYKDLLCEIQIRTLLQHTWAEIEHDLGYKSDIAIPKNIKRRFYRLAGLLEIADDEFKTIIGSLDTYTKKVDKKIETSPKTVLIDKVSLTSYVESSEIVKQIDKQIAKAFGSKMKMGFKPFISYELLILKFFGIKTIDQLNSLIKENEKEIVEFAQYWSADYGKSRGFFTPGITIFYLGYFLVGAIKDIKKIGEYLRLVFQEDRISRAEKIIGIYEKIVR